jgi:hypothetical protein
VDSLNRHMDCGISHGVADGTVGRTERILLILDESIWATLITRKNSTNYRSYGGRAEVPPTPIDD